MNPNVNATSSPPPMRTRNHHYNSWQTQILESFFEECSYPNKRQKRELSRQLGLEYLQIKCWFQSKRTQMKFQQEREENSQLRSENEQLRVKHAKLKEALRNPCCAICGSAVGAISFEQHLLIMENAKIRQGIERIYALVGKPIPFMNSAGTSSSSAPPPPQPPFAAP